MYDLIYQFVNPFDEVLDGAGLGSLTEAIGGLMRIFTGPLADLPLIGPLFFEPLDAIADALYWKLFL